VRAVFARSDGTVPNEYWAYSALFIVNFAALLLIWLDPDVYGTLFWTEDHFIEQMTFVVLAALGGLCLVRAKSFYRLHGSVFAGACAVYGAIFLFGAGEEISWGQRMLGIETPEWFAERNRQEEMNLHNLRVGSGQVANFIYLAIEFSLVVYLVLIPYLHKRYEPLRRLLDGLAIPVPKLSSVVALGLAMLFSELIVHRWLMPREGGELTEFSLVYCIAVIFSFPANAGLFRMPKALHAEPLPSRASVAP
jgi:hypothetical protein